MFKLWPRWFLTYNKSVSEDNCCFKAGKQLPGMLRVNWRGNWSNICPLIQCEVFLVSNIRMFFSIFIVLFGGVTLHVTNCIISAEKILMPWHPLSYYPGSELSLKWGQTRLFPQLKQKVSKSSETCKSSLCAQPSNDAIPKEYCYRQFISRGTGQTASDVCSSVLQTALELPPLPHHMWTLGAVPFSHYALGSWISSFCLHTRQACTLLPLWIHGFSDWLLCVFAFLSLKNWERTESTDNTLSFGREQYEEYYFK